jgi:adenylosuccinate lyase
MIDRYITPKTKKFITDEYKFSKYLEVEKEIAKAHYELKLFDKEILNEILGAKFDINDIREREIYLKHDVLAFIESTTSNLSLGAKRYFHYGCTSNDIIDTASSLIYKELNTVILNDLDVLLNTIKEKAICYQDTLCIGRTHGVHSVITSFGLKFLYLYDNLARHKSKFLLARKDIEVGMVSGAVGNFNEINPIIEERVTSSLGLNSINISTQVISRDRHAFLAAIFSLIAKEVERFSLEIRLLSRTECLEVEEGFGENQKGSSAMPHKKNPVGSENLTGISRIISSSIFAMLDDIVLMHERDISHSSVERTLFLDDFLLIDYLLVRFNSIIKDLKINTKKIAQNIELNYETIFSERVLYHLIDKGYLRVDAYKIVQDNCFLSINKGINLSTLLIESKIITSDEASVIFDKKTFLKNVSEIYNKVFKL